MISRTLYSPTVALYTFSSAGRYQALPKPRIEGSVGIRSRISSSCCERPIGALSARGWWKPSSRSHVSSSVNSAYDAIATMASTSRVARTGAAAGSVRSKPVTQPPTKAIRSSNGASFLAAASRARFEFEMGLFTGNQFSQSARGSQVLFACAPFANGIHQGKEFVQLRVAQRSLWNGLIERGKGNSPYQSLGMRPNRWERRILTKVMV